MLEGYFNDLLAMAHFLALTSLQHFISLFSGVGEKGGLEFETLQRAALILKKISLETNALLNKFQ